MHVPPITTGLKKVQKDQKKDAGHCCVFPAQGHILDSLRQSTDRLVFVSQSIMMRISQLCGRRLIGLVLRCQCQNRL